MTAEPVYKYMTSSLEEIMAYCERVGYDVWRAMEIKVYTALSALLPEHYYDISLQVPEQDQELFVKVCCLFLLEQRSGCPHPVAFRDGRIIKRYM